MKDLSILIFSTDSYEDVWFPFFSLLNKYWPNKPKTYIATELKNCKYADVTCNYKDKNIQHWTTRMLNAVKKIKTEYVIFMDCDYLLREPVDTKEIEKCMKWMKKDKKIASFNYEMLIADCDFLEEEYPGYLRRFAYTPAIGVGQATLWRTKALIECLSLVETNPWTWEMLCERGPQFSTFFGKWKFYRRSSQDWVFHYENSGCIHDSEWYFDEILFLATYEKEIYNKCNFSKRGVQGIEGFTWPNLINLFNSISN